VSKREIIFEEAKRLFGRYGYLGFTLKQLAQACHMTAPALYYFYTSKAHLFRDCLLSEFEARRVVLERCTNSSSSLPEFAQKFALDAITVCNVHNFRAGQAIEEIIHLPDDIQQELRQSWDENLLAPVEVFLERVAPELIHVLPKRLVATFVINLATFTAAQNAEYSSEDLITLFVKTAEGLSALQKS
jgi:AcrR family transcriptional regulator